MEHWAHIAMSAGLLILLMISFWDVVIFSRRARKPIKRIFRGMIIEEKVDVLKKVKFDVNSIIFFGVFQLLFVALTAFLLLCKKISGADDSVLKKIPWSVGEKISNHHQYVGYGLIGMVALLGIFSFIVKQCLRSN